MLTLQTSFSCDDTEAPPVGSSEILFKIPRYETVGSGNSVMVETDKFTLTLNQNLTSKNYSLRVPIADVFGDNHGSVLPAYLRFKTAQGAKPTLADFSIPFSVDYGSGSDALYEAVWFNKTVKYQPPEPTPPPQPQISELGSMQRWCSHVSESRVPVLSLCSNCSTTVSIRHPA
jgi:hypothetical protein